MPSAVRMPQLGESVTEGTVIRWLKQPGDHVALDESLAEIETEKVNVEIPSPFEGTLTELLVPEGETVDVGVPIATIESAGGPAEPAASATATIAATAAGTSQSGNGRQADSRPVAPKGPAPATAAHGLPAATFSATGPLGPANAAHGMFSTGEVDQDASAPAIANRAETLPSPSAAPRSVGNPESTQRYSPAVLRLAGEHNVDLRALPGTGLGGRITRKDVQGWIDRRLAGTAAEPGSLSEERQLFAAAPAEPVAPAGSETVQDVQDSFDARTTGSPPMVEQPVRTAGGVSQPAPAEERSSGPRPLGEDEELEPLTSTRKAIAAHMSRSVRTSPHAWMMVEVDVSRLTAYRERIKQEFSNREGADLSYLPFMIKATVAALKQNPRLNSSWSDLGVVLKRRVNIGIAVDTPQGLVVPVIKDADKLSIAGLAKAISDLAVRARARRLRLEDVEGGTFTVDNVGPIGSIVSQPIINQPQCAIVTMEKIVKRPVVIDDAIAIRSMMNCCISFDHRIVDGGDIGPFMKMLKRNLEAMGDETPIY